MKQASNPSSGGTLPDTAKYLTFQLDAEEFGVRIIKVREIVRMMTITRIPRMPEHVLGVVNLRGQVIPIVDLRTRFGLPKLAASDDTRIIVADVTVDGETSCAGLVVDRVKEVILISNDCIEKEPVKRNDDEQSFVVGLAKIGSSVTAILDVDMILADTVRKEPAATKAA